MVLAGNEIWHAYFFGRRSTRNGFLGVLGYDVPWSYQLWRLNPGTV